MGKKTETKLATDLQTGEAAQSSAPASGDDSQDVIDNATAAVAESENTAAESLNDVEAGQDADPMATITAERDALKDQLLRALADTENMRRRSEREADTARKYGHTQFARDLVGAIDNLARALASAPDDKSSLDEFVQSLLTASGR